MSASIAKHSITIRGHRTSVSLEAAFWRELQMMAAERSTTLTALITQIDEHRGAANLSSALRLAVLDQLRAKPRGESIIRPERSEDR